MLVIDNPKMIIELLEAQFDQTTFHCTKLCYGVDNIMYSPKVTIIQKGAHLTVKVNKCEWNLRKQPNYIASISLSREQQKKLKIPQRIINKTSQLRTNAKLQERAINKGERQAATVAVSPKAMASMAPGKKPQKTTSHRRNKTQKVS